MLFRLGREPYYKQTMGVRLVSTLAALSAALAIPSFACAAPTAPAAGAPPTTPNGVAAAQQQATPSGDTSVAHGGPEKSTQRAPDFTLRSVDGNDVSLSNFIGKKVVLISFWATWCEPCMAEMPHIVELYNKYKDQGLVVLSISEDGPESLAQVPSVVHAKGMTFPVLLDPETEVGPRYNANPPLTVIVDSDGNVAERHGGYTAGAEKKFEEVIKVLLDKMHADQAADQAAGKDPAEAAKEKKGKDKLTVDFTNLSTLDYHFNNRNDTTVGQPLPSTIVDDNYGEWLNRLNFQAFYGRFRAGVRIESAAYFHAEPSEQFLYDFAQKRAGAGASGVDVWNYVNSFQRELQTRFVQTIYPTKLFVGYTAPGIDLTLGDFYAQLGRGLVFSVRKIDEVAMDTTVRGFKAQFKKSNDDTSLNFVVFGGQMNPLRFDEASGRRLNGAGSPVFFGFPSASDFTYYTFDHSGHAGYVTEGERPSYLEDSTVGAAVEAGPKFMTFGANADWLFRRSYDQAFVDCQAHGGGACAAQYPVFDTTNQSRLHNRIFTFSGSVDIPKIGDWGEFYLEVAGQQLTDGRATGLLPGGGFVTVPDLIGYAVYTSATVRGGPLSVNFEGKHYRKFFPLSANVNSSGASDPTFGAPEFDAVNYNQVPTVEPIYVEQLGQPNLCITGGRARADLRLNKDISTYAWAGNYVSFSEIDADNFNCKTDASLRTNTWDTAVGGDLNFDAGKSFVKAWVGVRNDDRAQASDNANTGGATTAFYREGYVRYDVSKHLKGDFTLQFQGLHRHRYEPLLAADSWNEGENYTALHWSPHMAFIFGYEYLGRTGCEPDPKVTLCHYFNGGVQFKAGESRAAWARIFESVRAFVGQQRGAIRCVSGVCRQFAPFEGARLELVSHY